MKKEKKQKKQKMTKEEKQAIARKMSFQERMPIKNIKNRLFVTKDDLYLPVFSIGQKAIDLMSEEEAIQFSNQLDSIFQSLSLLSAQFLLLPIPFDLKPYKTNQDRRYNEVQENLKDIKDKETKLMYALNDDDITEEEYKKIDAELEYVRKERQQVEACLKYISEQMFFVNKNLQSGKIANKHSYLVCLCKDAWNETTVQENAKRIEAALKQISNESHRCSESEMEKILVELYNPLRPEVYISY